MIRLVYREFMMRTGLYRLRKCPVQTFYRGSQWFSITGRMGAWMTEYLRLHPEYIRFFRYGACIDEVFFSTLAMLSPFTSGIVSDPRRYIRWEGGANGGPAFLTEEDITGFLKSPGFFARKIDDIELCRKLSDIIKTEQRSCE